LDIKKDEEDLAVVLFFKLQYYYHDKVKLK